MGFLRWITGLALVVITFTFVLSNRQQVDFFFDPIIDQISMPVYIPVLTALGIGFLFGSFYTWLSGHETRKNYRKMRKDVRKLEKQVDEESHSDLLFGK